MQLRIRQELAELRAADGGDDSWTQRLEKRNRVEALGRSIARDRHEPASGQIAEERGGRYPSQGLLRGSAEQKFQLLLELQERRFTLARVASAERQRPLRRRRSLNQSP